MDEFVTHDEYIDDMDVMDIHHVVNIVKPESVSLFDLFGYLPLCVQRMFNMFSLLSC